MLIVVTEEICDRRRETRDEARRLARNAIISDGDDICSIVVVDTEEILERSSETRA
jgi:hypothetical protein